jgi:hypothetical protein
MEEKDRENGTGRKQGSQARRKEWNGMERGKEKDRKKGTDRKQARVRQEGEKGSHGLEGRMEGLKD